MDTDPNVKAVVASFIFAGTRDIVFHPMAHSRILMQLGYEPRPPYLGHNLKSLLGFGDKVYKYSNGFIYCNDILKKIGWTGLYFTGLPAKIIYNNINANVTESLYNYATSDDEKNKKTLDTRKDLSEYIGEVTILLLAKVAAVLASYPFKLIMIRQISEVCEKEFRPTNMFVMIKEIFQKEGILGFYSGVTSNITGEALNLTLTATFVYFLDRFIIAKHADDFKHFTPMIANSVTSIFTYRFNVITTLLAVAHTKCSYSLPLNGIRDAYSYLVKINGLDRGGYFLFRQA